MLVSLVLISSAGAQAPGYLSHERMTERLKGLAEQQSNLVHLHQLAQSREGQEVWMVEVGAGDEEGRLTRPAMLVVAGIEGNDLVGPFAAVSWIERLAMRYGSASAEEETLDATIYVVPCLNPDATEDFFASPKVETCLNGAPNDEDHDGLMDEDGPEDLNRDGLITMMRVEDREGRYVLDPNENRLLVEADPVEGEAGTWRLLPEGIDSDHDKRWNEDGPGGTNFNRNFPYGYKYFAPDAGIHMVSEAETRALADFVVAHPHIGIVLTYGSSDNLRKTPEGAESPGRSKPMEALDEEDVGYYEQFGKLYRKTLGLDKELDSITEPGTFSDWMYFHRGRLSLAARPWDASLARGMAKPTKDEPSAAKETDPNDPNVPGEDAKSSKKDDRNKESREELAWFDEHWPEAFVPWESIEHPDFPDCRVEVGGYRPFSRRNPPAEMLPDLAAKHSAFLSELVRRLPRIEVARIECRFLADSIFEIEVHIANTGFLPTMLAHGRTTQEVHPTRVTLELEPECFLAGSRITYLPTIPGSGGTAKVRYTVRVPDRRQITFSVVSTLAGRAEGTIELLETSGTGAGRPSREKEDRYALEIKK